MKRDALDATLRLRRLALEDAMRELAACFRAEAEADQAVAAVEAAIERETEAASSLTADDAVVEAFGVWLKRARQDLRSAEAVRVRAETETVRARAVLTAARGAVKAAEEVIGAKDAARRADAARREQRALDEMGQRRHGSNDRWNGS